MRNICENCKQTIQVMCRKGTGICGENCAKENDERQRNSAAHQPNVEGDLSQPAEAEPYPRGSEQEHRGTRTRPQAVNGYPVSSGNVQ